MTDEKKLSICSDYADFTNKRQQPNPFRYASFALWCSYHHEELKSGEVQECHDYLVRNFTAETNAPDFGSFDPWID